MLLIAQLIYQLLLHSKTADSSYLNTMKFTDIFTTLSLLAAATTAAGSPLANFKRDGLMYPTSTWRRWVARGELKQDPQNQPLVVKTGDWTDATTAIVKFTFDGSAQDRTCKLLFDLGDTDTSTGTETVDVFSNINAPGWRGQQLGRIHVPAPGDADWIMSFHGMPEFPCPAAGQEMGLEFVGVGDVVTMQWDIGVTGPRVQVL